MKQAAENAGARKPEHTAQGEPLILLKRVGSTTYRVAVHFSQTSKESLDDKLVRLITREAGQ